MASERIEKLHQLLAIDPNDAFCLYALAQEHAKAGEHDVALRYFDRVLSVEPGHAYAYFHKARCLESAGRLDEARAVLRTALDRVGGETDAKAARELQEYLQSISP